MIAELQRQVADLKRRAFMAVGRGVLSAINDTTKCQSLQVELLDGETADEIEHFQTYGFSSVPFAGAEAITAAVGGLRSHSVVIAVADRRYRITGGAAGEVFMHDDQGQVVGLKRDGIYLDTPHALTMTAPAGVTINGSLTVTDNLTIGNGATGAMMLSQGAVGTVKAGVIVNLSD